MTARRPSKPWRVTLTGPDVEAKSAFTSEAKTYDFVRTSLGGDSPAEQARIEHWENGIWRWYETVTKEEMP
jgi:hypothetical protein